MVSVSLSPVQYPVNRFDRIILPGGGVRPRTLRSFEVSSREFKGRAVLLPYSAVLTGYWFCSFGRRPLILPC